ncbi:MAG: hypothetical protein K6A23_03805 [Butyrivibrio sp.]|nr:hypothetical protein [Butyrivibrio sp.]
MHITVGKSTSSDARSAVGEALRNSGKPKLIIFNAPYKMIGEVADIISKNYPDTKSIGTSGTAYYENSASDSHLITIAFGDDAVVDVGLMRNLSSCPVSDIVELENVVKNVGPEEGKTVCIEFCTGHEERLVTTMNVALHNKKVPLVGGTVFGVPDGQTAYVAINGKIYEDACCYAVIKNKAGRIRTYSENIYEADDSTPRHVATKVNLENKELISLDGRPAADVYTEELGISKSQVVNNVFQSPLGRLVGDEIFISSMYDVGKNGSLINYKIINENDTICILKLKDYDAVNASTRHKIKDENSHISFVFSVNCIYRHLLFANEGYLGTFLANMKNLGPHVGVVGGGEQYKRQHVNQTMVCAVFE